MNVDCFFNDFCFKIILQVAVLDGYDVDNSVVYFFYDGELNILAKFDIYDSVIGYFFEYYG